MKAVILAGGFGTRFSEETVNIPKPMIEIDGRPILLHLMNYLYKQGIKEFIICMGYKSEAIKSYFLRYKERVNDIKIDYNTNSISYLTSYDNKWVVNLVDTGLHTQIGGRIKKIIQYVKDDPYFLLTYGDGLSDININELLNHHQKMKRLATVTGVYPKGRFGIIKENYNIVTSFDEKPEKLDTIINGGFFILSPKVDNYIDGYDTVWELEPVNRLVKENELSVFKHTGFWHPMDTLKDKIYLESLIKNNLAPWMI